MQSSDSHFDPIRHLHQAVTLANSFRGATAPNPPVGAVAVDAEGQEICSFAHERAGTLHAEAQVLRECERRGLISKIHTLYITLEPCNHHGKTPPCSEAIIRSGIKNVVFSECDPHALASGGAQKLKAAGISTFQVSTPLTQDLIAPFRKRILTGLPWMTIKTAHTENGSMIPPLGQKTFTSQASLLLAHQLRKRADAILTGSGTVLADLPSFTVRHLPDHAGKIRFLAVMDRRGRIPKAWIQQRKEAGFEVLIASDLSQILTQLGQLGCLEVLVEAGPTLSKALLHAGYWDSHFRIQQGAANAADTVTEFRA